MARNPFARYKKVFTANLKALKNAMRQSGVPFKVTSTTRSWQDQAAIPASNPYPVAAPGRSQHQYGLAADLWIDGGNRDTTAFFGGMWRTAGLGWSESDPIHFALFDAVTWSQLLAAAEQIPAEGFAGTNLDIWSLLLSMLQGGTSGIGVSGQVTSTTPPPEPQYKSTGIQVGFSPARVGISRQEQRLYQAAFAKYNITNRQVQRLSGSSVNRSITPIMLPIGIPRSLS